MQLMYSSTVNGMQSSLNRIHFISHLELQIVLKPRCLHISNITMLVKNKELRLHKIFTLLHVTHHSLKCGQLKLCIRPEHNVMILFKGEI